MSSLTIRKTFRLSGVPADPHSVTLSSVNSILSVRYTRR